MAAVRFVNITVTCYPGLDAPAAARLSRLASQFDAEITVYLRGISANAKSILGLLSLCAKRGDVLRVEAVGADDLAALEAIENLFAGTLSVDGDKGFPNWPDLGPHRH